MKRVGLSILALVVLVAIALGMSITAGGGQESPPDDVVQVIPQEPLNGIPQEPIVITRTKPDLGPGVTERTFTYVQEP
jgi:hypothetical protein